MSDAPEEWELRYKIARAIHEGLGESWAYSNYSGNEWVACRDMLDSAADAVLAAIVPVTTPAEVAALRAERDAAAADNSKALTLLSDTYVVEVLALRAEVERLRDVEKWTRNYIYWATHNGFTDPENMLVCAEWDGLLAALARAALEAKP